MDVQRDFVIWETLLMEMVEQISLLLPFLISKAPPLEMKDRVYVSCIRSSMTYGSEARPLLADVGLKFEKADD